MTGLPDCQETMGQIQTKCVYLCSDYQKYVPENDQRITQKGLGFECVDLPIDFRTSIGEKITDIDEHREENNSKTEDAGAAKEKFQQNDSMTS